MTLKEYIPLAQRTSPEGHNKTLNGILGLMGESGEVVDLVKKWLFQSGKGAEFPKEKMIGELGDIMWYVVEAAVGIGIRLPETGDELINDVDLDYLFGDSDDRMVALAAHIYRGACEIYQIFCGSSFLFVNDYTETGAEALVANKVQRIFDKIIRCVRAIAVDACGTRFSDVIERNIEKLMKRYPNGFEAERSVNRAAYEGAGDE